MILKILFVLILLGPVPILLFEEAMVLQRGGQDSLATLLLGLAVLPYLGAFLWVLFVVFQRSSASDAQDRDL